jgi:competence protein ComEC
MSGIFVYTGVIGFLIGVAVRSVFPVPMIVTVLIGCVGIITGVMHMARRQKTHTFFAALSISLIFFCLGTIRANYAFTHEGNFLDGELGKTKIEGVVIDEPSFTEKSQKITLAVQKQKEKARVSIIAPPFPRFMYGDVLSVSGNLKKPESFVTDNGSEFNYPEYLAKDGIFQQMLYPNITLLSHDGGDMLHRVLFSIRRRFITAIETNLPEPNASLVNGIAIGAKDGMDTETEDMFRRVGLVHIVVLSGYNITVVSDTIMRLLAFLPRTLMLTGGGIVVLLFTIMTGATATAVRAASMALLALAARMFGRRYDIIRALFLVAFTMVVWNPRVLVFDPSFQLSFLATFGLITLSPIIERKLKRIPNVLSLRETISATLATQLFVVPFLIHMNGQVSIISLIANILVLPVVPLSMFFTYLLGGIGPFSNVLATILSFPTFFISEYILKASEFFSRIPFAAIQIYPPPWWVFVGIYIGLLLFLRLNLTNSKRFNLEAPNVSGGAGF